MKKIKWFLFVCLSFALNMSFGQISTSATETSPIMNGESIPHVQLLNLDSESVDLQALIGEKPTMLLFYRGSWCPYCNVQLADLQEASDQLLALGMQIIAISPDTPEKMLASVNKNKLSYLYCPTMTLNLSKKWVWHLRTEKAEYYLFLQSI